MQELHVVISYEAIPMYSNPNLVSMQVCKVKTLRQSYNVAKMQRLYIRTELHIQAAAFFCQSATAALLTVEMNL